MTIAARPAWVAGQAVAISTVLEPNVLMFGYQCIVAGITGTAEPAWPLTAGATIVDGTVTWQAFAANTLTWTAVALYTTGTTEPAWPTTVGATVVDNGVTWTMRTPAIIDTKCPQSKVAIKMAQKIFSPYRDVVRYCVTDYPRDWSTENDAGFLPTGLHSSESPECTALGEYRGRLAVFTNSDLQLWTVDPDPAEMGIFDNLAGLGSPYGKAAATIAGDLYFMTTFGVRSLSVAAGATNLAAGDVGSVIDVLIRAVLASPNEPLATYYPGNGQFWIIFGSQVFVYSRSRAGRLGTWSRYLYPYNIEYTAQMNNLLYYRSGDNIYLVDENAVSDNGTTFEGVVWGNYMEMGNSGTTKMIDSFDITQYGSCEVSFGWDEIGTASYTPPLLIAPDTVTGGRIPMPIAAPSIAIKLRFLPGQSWQLNSMNLYINDFRPGL